MIITQKRHGMKVAEIWFDEPTDFKEKSFGLIEYRDMQKPPQKKKGQLEISRQERLTLTSSLTLSNDELLALCASNVRNEIRRAQKDGTSVDVFDSERLKSRPEVIEKFDAAYGAMHKQKNLPIVSTKNGLTGLMSHNVLVITVAYIPALDYPVAWHVYVYGSNVARLLYSVSVFRETESSQLRTEIGRANRYLHYEDMMYFKKLSYLVYDWGGYSTESSLEGINKFKAGFGGQIENRYFQTSTVYCSVALLFWIRRLIKKT